MELERLISLADHILAFPWHGSAPPAEIQQMRAFLVSLLQDSDTQTT